MSNNVPSRDEQREQQIADLCDQSLEMIEQSDAPPDVKSRLTTIINNVRPMLIALGIAALGAVLSKAGEGVDPSAVVSQAQQSVEGSSISMDTVKFLGQLMTLLGIAGAAAYFGMKADERE